MGYGGYAPGANSRMADKLTPLQEALRALPLEHIDANGEAHDVMETLALIEKLTRNIVQNPSEAKFRNINLANGKIKKAIADMPNAIALMQEMGWVLEMEVDERKPLVLPPNVRLSHHPHVVEIIEAQDHYKTKAKKEAVSQMRASKAMDADAELLRKQIEADRKEKAAQGPVTQDSVAKRIGGGANITRCSDVGIGQSRGG
jgi:hypothetical protein